MTILAKWKGQWVFWLWNIIFATSVIFAFTGATTLQPILNYLRHFFGGIAYAMGVVTDIPSQNTNTPLEMWHYWEFAAFFSTLVFNGLFLYVGWWRKQEKQDTRRGKFVVRANAQQQVVVIVLLFVAAFAALLLAITVSVVDGKCWIQVLCVLAVMACFLKIDRIMATHAEDESVRQDFSASVRLNDQPAVLAFCVLLVFAILRFPTADIKKVTQVEGGLANLKIAAQLQRSNLTPAVDRLQETVGEWKSLEEKKFRGFIGGAIAFQMLLSNTVLALIFREKGEATVGAMKSTPRRLLVILVCAGILAGWLWWQAHPPKIPANLNVSASLLGRPLRVGIVSWPGYAGGIVANDGFKPNEKCIFWNNHRLLVEFVLLEDVDARAKAFASGGIDVTWSTVDFWANELAGLLNNGVKARAVMQVDWSRGGDAIVVDKSINAIDDLKGKKISLALFTPSHWLLEYSLEQSYLTAEDQAQIVKNIVEKNASTDARQDFVAGKVDAAVVWEPDVTGALKERASSHVLRSTKDFPDIIADIMVVREEFISQHPNVIRAFIEGWLEGTKAANQNPDKAVKLLMENEPLYEVLGAPLTKEGLNTVKWADLSDNAKMFGLDGTPPIFDRIFTQAGAAWKKRDYIKDAKTPDVAKEDRFLRDILSSAASGAAH